MISVTLQLHPKKKMFILFENKSCEFRDNKRSDQFFSYCDLNISQTHSFLISVCRYFALSAVAQNMPKHQPHSFDLTHFSSLNSCWFPSRIQANEWMDVWMKLWVCLGYAHFGLRICYQANNRFNLNGCYVKQKYVVVHTKQT